MTWMTENLHRHIVGMYSFVGSHFASADKQIIILSLSLVIVRCNTGIQQVANIDDSTVPTTANVHRENKYKFNIHK